jgi:lysophospholipid acyltransferase (LPLAT)-like uncharacterized protein
VLVRIASWLVAIAVTMLRWTVRIRFHNDPREFLRARGDNYLFSFLHAHQLGLILGGEKGTGAMVSRSKDGELIVPLLKVSGCVPVRGSSKVNRKDRGGKEALHTLVDHVQSGKPAALAVDGPRGPRGRVHKGIALLSQQTDAPVINLVAISRRKWKVTKAWDRMQIPIPFTLIDGYFADPIYPRSGEKLEAYRQRIEASLHALEMLHEPNEAAYNCRSMLANGECTVDEDVDMSDDFPTHEIRSAA